MALLEKFRQSNGHITWTGQTKDVTAKAVAEYCATPEGGNWEWMWDDGKLLLLALDSEGLILSVTLDESYA